MIGAFVELFTVMSFKNIEDPLPGFMIRNKCKRFLVESFKKDYELSTD